MSSEQSQLDDAGDSERPEGPDETAWRSRHVWVLALVLAACVAPLMAGALGLAAKGWVPVGEFAQAELRLRDFWAHPPDLGAVARLRTSAGVASHPGPVAWWAMYPFYALLGRSAVALSSAVAATAAAWLVLALTMAWRRAGDALTVILGVVVLLLVGALGPRTFLEPWNPWFAVMPFLAMLVALWSVLDGSPWASVVVVAAGSYCVQSHLGYAPLVAVLVVLMAVGLWLHAARDGGGLRTLAAPVGTALGVGAVMWALPVLEQFTGDPGNFAVMVAAYRAESDNEPVLGLGGALRLVGSYANLRAPVLLLEDLGPTERSPDLGTMAFLAAWIAAGVFCVRRRSRPGFRSAGALWVVGAVGLLGAVVTASRIPGQVFGYLILWLGVLVAVMAVAAAWTAWLVLRTSGGATLRHWVGVLGLVAVVVLSVNAVVRFADPPVPGGTLSEVAAGLVDPVLDGLDTEGPYVVRWEDPVAFGALGTALLSELERAGVDVGVDRYLAVEMRPHRVLDAEDARGALWVVTGAGIDRFRELPGVSELAVVDPRSASERARSDALRVKLTDELAAIGGPALADALEENSWIVRSDPRVEPELVRRIDELAALGSRTAVFLAPTGLVQPAPR